MRARGYIASVERSREALVTGFRVARGLVHYRFDIVCEEVEGLSNADLGAPVVILTEERPNTIGGRLVDERPTLDEVRRAVRRERERVEPAAPPRAPATPPRAPATPPRAPEPAPPPTPAEPARAPEPVRTPEPAPPARATEPTPTSRWSLLEVD